MRKRTSADNLLIMANCGDHECDVDQSDLLVELLPPKSTHKFQTRDLGIIAHLKIRYRSMLPRSVVNITLE